MADRLLFFDDILREPNLRSKHYVLLDAPAAGLTCIELSARRGDDWFFARRWVSVVAGRRLLYWLMDEAESHAFRFRISRAPVRPDGSPPNEPWVRASAQWAQLAEDERQIHREIFPQEESLLNAGYDWDHAGVYREGKELPRDVAGRILEDHEGIVYEWVCVRDEFTWRRFPLYRASGRSGPLPPPSSPGGPARQPA